MQRVLQLQLNPLSSLFVIFMEYIEKGNSLSQTTDDT